MQVVNPLHAVVIPGQVRGQRRKVSDPGNAGIEERHQAGGKAEGAVRQDVEWPVADHAALAQGVGCAHQVPHPLAQYRFAGDEPVLHQQARFLPRFADAAQVDGQHVQPASVGLVHPVVDESLGFAARVRQDDRAHRLTRPHEDGRQKHIPVAPDEPLLHPPASVSGRVDDFDADSAALAGEATEDLVLQERHHVFPVRRQFGSGREFSRTAVAASVLFRDVGERFRVRGKLAGRQGA